MKASRLMQASDLMQDFRLMQAYGLYAGFPPNASSERLVMPFGR
ncbi:MULTISPECIES: hypothetical protein [Paenibacillus]|nr:hypothetical protein [Paenibacillus sp. IHBB 10380]